MTGKGLKQLRVIQKFPVVFLTRKKLDNLFSNIPVNPKKKKFYYSLMIHKMRSLKLVIKGNKRGIRRKK